MIGIHLPLPEALINGKRLSVSLMCSTLDTPCCNCMTRHIAGVNEVATPEHDNRGRTPWHRPEACSDVAVDESIALARWAGPD